MNEQENQNKYYNRFEGRTKTQATPDSWKAMLATLDHTTYW